MPPPPAVRTPINWYNRQLSNPISAGTYVYDFQCLSATTQNWHLSAFIGGILGVVFALFLGILLLFLLRRNHCLPGGYGSFGKQMTQRSLLGNSSSLRGTSNRRGRQSSSKRSSFHSSLWPSRSSNSRSEFSGHLRELEDDDVDEDDEVIAEDDEEDTEIDTGCKSSVRSQVGIYGGSGGTTGSSNRHSSMSSSIDAREDSSSVAMPYLPVNGVPSRSATRRSRDLKRPLMGYDSMKNISGVEVNVVAPTPDVIGTKEDLRRPSIAKISDSSRQMSSTSPLTNIPDPLLEPTIISLRSPEVNIPPPLSKQPPISVLDIEAHGEFLSPVPIQEPQSVDLQIPILVDMNSTKENCIWIESPKFEPPSHVITDIPETYFENDDRNIPSNLDFESTLNLTDATSGTSRESIISSSNYDYEYYGSLQKLEGGDQNDPDKSGLSIYTEFVETI
nr:dynein light chain [Hymenolepis microstoma]